MKNPGSRRFISREKLERVYGDNRNVFDTAEELGVSVSRIYGLLRKYEIPLVKAPPRVFQRPASRTLTPVIVDAMDRAKQLLLAGYKYNEIEAMTGVSRFRLLRYMKGIAPQRKTHKITDISPATEE